MKQTKLNRDWTFMAGEVNMMASMMGITQETSQVDLPHDAMILEERKPDTGNGGHTGFYPGGVYTYNKSLDVPMEWQNKDIYLEFEGVFANAQVYVNDDLVAQRPYGYSEFHAMLNDYLIYGQQNEIKVICNTQVEHQSRWYTGSGIYRDVNLYVSDPLHVSLHGLKIVTEDVEPESAVVEINLNIENNSRIVRESLILIELMDKYGNVVKSVKTPLTMRSHSTTNLRKRLVINNPLLWSCDTPDLYSCHVQVIENNTAIDETESAFGIRKIQLDAVHGLRINGARTKLRGACIHHDNGVVGAAAFARAEVRRVEQLKEAGFNCVRSSHNPAGRALLDACDRVGMLMMDETFDVWMKCKTQNDYANFFMDWWERDVEAMVLKDINHPCVIMYSLGNELPEITNRFGKDWNRRMIDKIRSLDDSRFLTNSLNLLFLNEFKQVAGQIMTEMGIDLTAQAPAADEGDGSEKDSSGSNALNSMMSMLNGPLSDKIMAHELIDAKSNEFLDALDVAGMNYSPGKYAADAELHPDRVILGTEDFPGDIVRLWAEVKKYPQVIGDMTWTGYDYLGEAGSGTFSYDGKPTFGAPYPARAAGMGDIDLIGNRHPISYLREIVYGLRAEPYIGVERVDRYGQEAMKTPWKLHDDIASWTWPGFKNKPARVYVYSASEEVELMLNGESLGVLPAGENNGYTATFETVYKPGELIAVGRTAGVEDGRMTLQTAGDEIVITAQVDREQLQADGNDLAYVMLKLTDKNGIWNRSAQKNVTVTVEGAGCLQGLGSADPFGSGNFFDSSADSHDGALLAVIRAGHNAGEITVKASAPDCEDCVVILRTN
jgi:hypothetical protein